MARSACTLTPHNRLNSQGNAGVVVLCGFLQLLRIVVEEPTAVFASFLQSILDLCFGPLKEVRNSSHSTDTYTLETAR